MVSEDERFKLEKTVFEDLAIYKIEVMVFAPFWLFWLNAFQIEHVVAGDAGEYSCEMIAKNYDIEKTREFVTVSVFLRDSEEYIEGEVNDEEEINFIGPEDVGNSEYASAGIK